MGSVGFTGNIASDRAVLGGLLDRLGLPATLLSLLLAHAEAVERNATRLGLVSARDVDHVISRHTVDSVLFALVRRPEPRERWIDVGSGAGFPGLVLAACFPESRFTLLEPLKRRAGFLDLASADLGLGNVTVLTSRLEELTDDGYDVAVARALADPESALLAMTRLLKRDGQAIVAISPNATVGTTSTLVTLEDLGNVDSPGLFSIMTRRG